MKCNNCGTELPEASRFCLRCGKETVWEAPSKEDDGSNFNIFSIMLFALAFMLFFFSMIPMFLDSWEGAVLMDSVGVVVVIIAFINLWSTRRQAERAAERREQAAERMLKAQQEAMAKLKCRYCGALNDHSALKCETCGATL
jgi:hypothetical protein